MKYVVCLTGEFWFDTEAESEEQVKQIAEEKQKDKNLFDEMKFKEPFVMPKFPHSYSKEETEKAYSEFLKNHPGFEKKMKKARKSSEKTLKKIKKLKSFDKFFTQDELKDYAEYMRKYGYSQGFNGGAFSDVLITNILTSFVR